MILCFWFGLPFGSPNPSPSFVSDGIILECAAIVLKNAAQPQHMCCIIAALVQHIYSTIAAHLQHCSSTFKTPLQHIYSTIVEHDHNKIVYSAEMCEIVPVLELMMGNVKICCNCAKKFLNLCHLLFIIFVPSEVQT